MTDTTFSFRISPPLYGLQDAEFELTRVGDFERVHVKITLVDSGMPLSVKVATRGEGSGVTLPGDNLGVLHSTRLDVTVPGTIAEWNDVNGRRLAQVANRIIDWYRLQAGRPSVRRMPENTVGGYEAHDTDGGVVVLMQPLAASPGERSKSAGGADQDLLARLRGSVERPFPLWVALYLDAYAEFLAGELRVAVLLANVSMETLVNRAFRAVVSPEDVEAAFGGLSDPPSFWQLIKRVNEIE